MLTDELIDAMTGSLFDPHFIPAHVEIAARVQAASTADLDAGRYTLHIPRPAPPGPSPAASPRLRPNRP
jgi:hypothetical protein